MYAFLSGHELRRDIGQAYEYSNLGVGLLGHVLARVGGESYEDVNSLPSAPSPVEISGEVLQARIGLHGHDPMAMP